MDAIVVDVLARVLIASTQRSELRLPTFRFVAVLVIAYSARPCGQLPLQDRRISRNESRHLNSVDNSDRLQPSSSLSEFD